MMGSGESPEGIGIIPRLCKDLLHEILGEFSSKSPNRTVKEKKMSITYCEIYNEKVYDLLSTNPGVASRIRESPNLGAYVEGINKRNICTFDDIAIVLDEGHRKRAVASTLMNSVSSRSHAIFTIYLVQQSGELEEIASERSSKVCLVDLAGRYSINNLFIFIFFKKDFILIIMQ
jgi:hypothetical protein